MSVQKDQKAVAYELLAKLLNDEVQVRKKKNISQNSTFLLIGKQEKNLFHILQNL